MKRLYLLPGNDSKNLAWITQISEKIGKGFDSVEIQKYDHWQTGGPVINWEVEYKKLEQSLKDTVDDELVVFGKSAGTLLTLLGINRGLFRPRSVIMCGLPLKWGYEQKLPVDDMLHMLLKLNVKTLVVQQENDRVGSALTTKDVLTKNGFVEGNLFEFLTIPGADHAYSEFESYVPYVNKFLNNFLK